MLRYGSKVNTTDLGQSYPTTGKPLHWGIIIVFSYGIFQQVDDLSQLEDPAFLWFELIFACAFLSILALRLWVMRGQGSTLPESILGSKRIAAKLMHYGMYVALTTIARHRAGYRCGLHAWNARRGAHCRLHRGARGQHHCKLRSDHAPCCCGGSSPYFTQWAMACGGTDIQRAGKGAGQD
jgi:hypothetical protein